MERAVWTPWSDCSSASVFEEEKCINLNGTLVVSDRGYNNDKYQESTVQHADLLNTVKRGPSLCFKFGSTSYKTLRNQRDLSEMGPKTVLMAYRMLGEKRQDFVAYRNGTGRVVFVATTKRGMDGCDWTITSKSGAGRQGMQKDPGSPARSFSQ